MARQHIDYTTSANSPPNAPLDDGLDTGQSDDLAVRPIIDGEPAQGAVFKRPSENLRTRTEIVRAELEALKFLSDIDRNLLLVSTGDVTWNGLPTGTFVPTQNLVLKPFLSPVSCTPSKLLICTGDGGTPANLGKCQITIRTKKMNATGQPRAYNGANDISLDFQPVTVGDGSIVVSVSGTPANNVHVQYDDHATNGTTVDQIPANSFLVQFNASAVAIALNLEAVVEGGGTPPEYGFPTPQPSVAASRIRDYITGPEQATRYMSGAADAEKHVITPGTLSSFFGADGGTLNKFIEGDVLCIWYDALTANSYGGRRQSIDEAPESTFPYSGANIPAGSLFMLRRFPGRLPGALPVCTVQDGKLIFINGRVYGSGESGPLVSSGASYQGSGTWVNGVAGISAGSFEAAVDAIVAQLALATGTSGAARIGATAITGIAAGSVQFQLQALSDGVSGGGGDLTAHLNDTADAHDASAISSVAAGNLAATDVQAALNELDTEKAGLALANTFTKANIFQPSVTASTAVTAHGNTTGPGIHAIGGTKHAVFATAINSGASAHTLWAETVDTGAFTPTGGPYPIVAVAGDVPGNGYAILGAGSTEVGGSGIVGLADRSVSVPAVNGAGVVGMGTAYGVYGGGYPEDIGVYGQVDGSGKGVRGSSNSGEGVYGSSTTGPGGYFTGGSTIYGVLFALSELTDTAPAIIGQVQNINNGHGVIGRGTASNAGSTMQSCGGYFEARGGHNSGVYGLGRGTQAGVKGQGQTTGTDNGIGVWGLGGAVDGIGGKFSSTGAGPGVDADCSGAAPGLHVYARNKWDLINTDGDFRISNGTYKLKFAIATGGGGAGLAGIYATNGIFLGGGGFTDILSVGAGGATVKTPTATAPALTVNVAAGGPAIRCSGTASAPGSPSAGDIFFDSAMRRWRKYFGAVSGWSHTRYVVGDNGPAYSAPWALGYAPGGTFRYDNLYYWLDFDGVLHMGGEAYGGAGTIGTGETIFTIPTGFRQTTGGGELRNYPVAGYTTSYGTFSTWHVGIDYLGTVKLWGGLKHATQTVIYMDPIKYEAALG